MKTTEWNRYDRWHLLFDALCRAQGHQQNAVLASELCARFSRNSRADFDAAKKQLRNWRSGQRLPLKRNVAVLGQLLAIDTDPDLERHWQALYRQAQQRRGAGSSSDAREAAAAPRRAESTLSRRVMLAGAMLLGGVGLALSPVSSELRAVPSELPIVNFEGSVRVPLGATVLIHGHPGKCDGQPPEWDEFAGEIPTTQLGAFSDGGLARKVVRRCTSERVVRGIRFTGTNVGTDGIRLFGDYIRINVVSAL